MLKFWANVLYGTSFLGINGGFWFCGMPFTIFLYWAEVFNSESEESPADRLPNTPVYIALRKKDLDMLEDIKRRLDIDKKETCLKRIIREELEDE